MYNNKKVVSIHQPNFLPWIGYFNKIANSDLFIILDTAKHSRRATVLKRNKIKLQDKEHYLIVPIGSKELQINQLFFSQTSWKVKHINLLKQAYSKTPYFQELFEGFKKIYLEDELNVSKFNLKFIYHINRLLNINTKIIIESELEDNFGTKNERNLNLCKYFNADIYLSGVGAKDYNDIESFNKVGIELIYQNLAYPTYSQIGKDFISHLSIVDMLFNIGPSETEKLVKKNCLK